MNKIKLFAIGFLLGGLLVFLLFVIEKRSNQFTKEHLNNAFMLSSDVPNNVELKDVESYVKSCKLPITPPAIKSTPKKETLPASVQHTYNYLLESKIIEDGDSVAQAKKALIDDFQDAAFTFNERLEKISIYSHLNSNRLPEQSVDILLTDLQQLDESYSSDEMVQVINLLYGNISNYQIHELSLYLGNQDPHVLASVIKVIGKADDYREYQEAIIDLWQNSLSQSVRASAFIALDKSYSYNFELENTN